MSWSFRQLVNQFAPCWPSVLLVCLVSAVQAQYRFDSWAMAEGLPQNSVTALVQTRDGYLWFTTIDGLVRFDGLRFTVFDRSNVPAISSNRFVSLHEDATSTLWAGTDNSGLVRYRDGEFTSLKQVQGLPSNDIEEIRSNPAGDIFIRYPGGYGALRDGQFTPMTDPLSTLQEKAFTAPNGVKWQVTSPEILSQTTTPQWERVIHQLFKYQTYYIARIASGKLVFQDRHGNLWGCANDRQLFRVQNGNLTFFGVQQDISPPPSKAWDTTPSFVQTAVEDRDGTLWFGTNRGLLCFREGHFKRYTIADGLAGNDISTLLVDREGIVWAGTPSGLTRITKQSITTLSTAEGLPYKVVNPILQESSGSVLIGSYLLTRYAQGKLTTFPVSDRKIQPSIESLYEDPQGVLWVGLKGETWSIRNGRAEQFANARFQAAYPAAIAPTCYAFWQDRARNFWFCTDQGLFKFTDGNLTAYTTANGMPTNEFRVAFEDREGNLWFGTHSGLVKWQANQFVAFAGQSQLLNERIFALHQTKDDALWIGTYDNGLRRLKDNHLTAYKAEHGLFINEVFRILEDERENFWISSNRGIYRVNKQQLDEFAAGKIAAINSVAYGRADGMRNAECNAGRSPAGSKMRDGKLWFPTQDGVAIVDPTAQTVNPLPPPVVIEHAFINRQAVPFRTELKLQPGQENLEIAYTGLSFIKPEQIKFKYKLEGWDTDWIDAGTRRSAFYSYLRPGNYRFKVMAANSDGLWSETSAELSLVVVPPFYRTWWFSMLVAVALAASVYGLYALRIRQLRDVHTARETFSQQLLTLQESYSRQLIQSQESERQRIATELHDGLGQNLLVAKNRALLGAAITADAQAKGQFDEINALIASTLSEVRSISQNLRPPHLERLGLTATIEEMLEQIAASTDLQITQQIETLDGLFNQEAELHLFRICQECLNNVIKHAQASRLSFGITIEAESVRIVVSDNGAGCDVNALSQTAPRGSGWLSINERVRILRGTVNIESAPAQGTSITIQIPLMP